MRRRLARLRHVVDNETREVVPVHRLLVDVAAQVLVVGGRRHVGLVAEVLLPRQVDRVGSPRIQRRVAAGGARPAGRAIDAELQARVHLLHPRTRHLLGQREAHRLLARQAPGQVHRGQVVGVGLAALDRLHAAGVVVERRVPVVGLRGLVGAHDLQADVAAHRHAEGGCVQVALQEGGGRLLLDLPGLGDQVAGRLRRREGHVAADRARHVPGRDQSQAGEAQVHRAVLQVRRDRGIALRADVDVAFRLALLLRAVRVVQARLEVGEQPRGEVGRRQVAHQLEAGQLVLDAGHLAVAGAVDRVLQQQLGRVRIVAQPRHDLREAAGAERQAHVVQRPVGRGGPGQLRVVLQAQLVAGGARVVHVGHQRQAALELQLVVPARGDDLVVALVVHAAHQRIGVQQRAAGLGAVVVDGGVRPVQAGRRVVAVPAQVHLELVGGVDLLGLGPEAVDDAGPVLARTELDRAHQRVALALASAAQGLDAAGVVGARRQAGAAGLVPGLIEADLLFLDRRLLVRIPQRHADAAVGELVDVAGAQAVAGGAGVGRLAQRVALAAGVQRHHAVAEIQRADRLHVDGARQALADQPRFRRLVDHHGAEQLGRVLVELDAAVVAGGDQFAAVEQRGREVGRQAAHRDHLRAARDALGRQAGQAGDGLGDRHVGQLADVLGGDGLDDRVGILLDRDGGLDAAADAGDGHRPQRLVGRGLGSGFLVRFGLGLLRLGGAGHQGQRHQAAGGDRLHTEQLAGGVRCLHWVCLL